MNPILICTLVPLLGTTLGAASVYFVKGALPALIKNSLIGFAAGVMIAASVWSLITPSLEQSESLGQWAFAPAFIGIWLGVLFLWSLDHLIPHFHAATNEREGPSLGFSKTTMMVFAIILHNIPEGMAIGVVAAGWLSGNTSIGVSAVLALSLGIALQNFPEGAIVSLPLVSEGTKRNKAFLWGFLSGVVEPVGTIITILLAELIIPTLPYLLGFAAGAMIYVVVEDLIPEMSAGSHSNIGTLWFAAGFTLMMALDIALG